MPKIRLFTAVDISPDIQKRLENFINTIKKEIRENVYLKFVETENLHITLKFIGEVEESMVESIKTELEKVIIGEKEAILKIKGIGAFPDLYSARVYWVGIEGDTKILSKLFEKIDSTLERIGIERERKAFSPHLTIARLKRGNPKNLAKYFSNYMDEEFGEFIAKEFHLYQSILKPEGPIYKKLSSFVFK